MADLSLTNNQKNWLPENSRGFAALDEIVYKKLLEQLLQLSGVSSAAKAREVIEQISIAHNAPANDIRGALGWMSTIAKIASDAVSMEACQNLLLPLIEGVEGLTEEDRTTIKRRLADTFSHAEGVASEFLLVEAKRAAVKGVLSYFEDIEATVELRGVIEGDVFSHIDAEGPFVALEPVASIRLSLDSGFPSDSLFQIGRTDLDRLIKSLQALGNRMDDLSRFAAEVAKK